MEPTNSCDRSPKQNTDKEMPREAGTDARRKGRPPKREPAELGTVPKRGRKCGRKQRRKGNAAYNAGYKFCPRGLKSMGCRLLLCIIERKDGVMI